MVASEIKTGSITTASEQQSLLEQTNDLLTDPRAAFRRDLMATIKASIDSGNEILLMGDFKEVFGTDVEGMIKIANACGLKDLMTIRNSSISPATYARGRAQLDYALATNHVANSLSRAGYEAFNAKYPSDHRSYFLDFDTKKLFGAETQQLCKPSNRILQSTNVNQTTEYIKVKYDMIVAHNAFARGDRLTLPGDRHAYAERLNKDVADASLAAEGKLKRYGESEWSLALDKAKKTVVCLKKCLSMARTGRDVTPHLTNSQLSDWDEPFLIPTTVQECSKQLREANRKVDDIIQASFATRDQERRARITALEQSPLRGDKEHCQKLRQLQKAEDIKQLFQKLKTVRQNDVRKG